MASLNPERLAQSGTEHGEQAALMCWANMAACAGFEAANDMNSYSALRTRERKDFGTARPVECLKWLHAIPNAGARSNKIAAAQLKAEGVKAGVADVFLPVSIRLPAPLGPLGQTMPVLYCGLYIEMKRADGKPSDLSKEQYEFANFVSGQGFAWQCCFGWRQAAEAIQLYLKGERLGT